MQLYFTVKHPNLLTVSKKLYKMGFFVPVIRPPTVPTGTARLRLSVQSEHTEEQMDKLCGGFEKLIKQGILPIRMT